jgi:predicted nucleotidyltransferase
MSAAPGLSLSRLERLHHDRASERRRLAIARANEATARLCELGVKARIIGSLASGRFRSGSDIDFLIVECPRHLKYGIEGIVEDCLEGLPFDVIYLDEIPAHKLARFTREAVDARDLR